MGQNGHFISLIHNLMFAVPSALGFSSTPSIHKFEEVMALDVAEFLWSKFLNSLQEAESELSGSISISYFKSIKNLLSHFKKIKNVVKEEIDKMSQSYSETIDVLYELNDALADCRIFTHECKELNKQLLIFSPSTYFFIHKMKTRLKTIKRKLKNLTTQREENDDRYYTPGKSGPLLSSQVFGFEEHVEKIKRLLLASSCNGFTAVGVVGIAGVGKTTLVQKVLDEKTVKDEFHPIIWVPFSGVREEQQQFSRFSFETCILDNLGRTVDVRIVGLGKLFERLNQLLSGKRYLVVVDDVQRRHINIEDRLCRGLPKGSGGVVIVTSRLKEVAQKLVEQKNLIHVEPLGKEICWSIFEESIQNDREISSFSHRQTLGNIKEDIMAQCYGLPLAAKTFAQIIPEQIREIESKRFLMEMYIPDELLTPDLSGKISVHIPNCPVLVFIDVKNEQHGEQLFHEFCYRLNKKQVFAILEGSSDSKRKIKAENPETVLEKVYRTLRNLKSEGHDFADDIQKRMRIIIVGGDAVANWILRVICDLQLPESPSIVPITQGTEDKIPLSFGWKAFKANRESVTSFLSQVTVAQQMKTDSWHILITKKASRSSTADQEIPHPLRLFHPVRKGDNSKLSGGFWSYFSLEFDAPRRYGACWLHPAARTLSTFAKVEVMKHDQWVSLKVSGIKSIVCLNLPSESHPRGSSNMKRDPKRQQYQSSIDDGHLEIFSLKDVLLRQSGLNFLDQVQGIRFKFNVGAAEFVKMRIDGAVWEKIPLDRISDIEISCHPKVNILANGDCPAKPSVHVSAEPSASGTDDNNNGNAEDNSIDDRNNAEDKSKARIKFGSASTFKIA